MMYRLQDLNITTYKTLTVDKYTDPEDCTVRGIRKLMEGVPDDARFVVTNYKESSYRLVLATITPKNTKEHSH
jgi:hypothetical protein